MQKKLENQNNVKPKSQTGRPSDYTQQKADLICEMIATHQIGIREICQQHSELPNVRTIYIWLYKHEDFRHQYAQAKRMQADLLAEQCLSICDSSSPELVNVDRLKIDTRKWLAAKLLPKQYGDHRLLEQKIEENETLKEELIRLRAKLDQQYIREF